MPLLTPDSAIVTSRKRKLREFFAVTNQVDPLPQDAFANPDAPATTAAEWQFLQTSEILQFVYTFSEMTLSCCKRRQKSNTDPVRDTQPRSSACLRVCHVPT